MSCNERPRIVFNPQVRAELYSEGPSAQDVDMLVRSGNYDDLMASLAYPEELSDMYRANGYRPGGQEVRIFDKNEHTRFVDMLVHRFGQSNSLVGPALCSRGQVVAGSAALWLAQ